MTTEKDLGPELEAWSRTRHPWTPDELVGLGAELAEALESEKDWDGFAGENWLAVFEGDVILVYVHASYPLVVVKESVAARVQEVAPSSVPIIVIPDSAEPVLRCDPEILKLAFPEDAASFEEAIGYGEFNPAAFSMGDLYFRTV
ncbi:hypothetical protein [Spirillospora sp. CA-294931]|uniref:hypothetical protein n=1 Tax=Spirillospora sp. CA-294931 TaxID=3240042 RepID=UPI003D8FFDC6